MSPSVCATLCEYDDVNEGRPANREVYYIELAVSKPYVCFDAQNSNIQSRE